MPKKVTLPISMLGKVFVPPSLIIGYAVKCARTVGTPNSEVRVLVFIIIIAEREAQLPVMYEIGNVQE